MSNRSWRSLRLLYQFPYQFRHGLSVIAVTNAKVERHPFSYNYRNMTDLEVKNFEKKLNSFSNTVLRHPQTTQ